MNGLPVSQPHDPASLLTRAEAAQYLRCSIDMIDRMIRSGRLPSYRIGLLIRLRRTDVEALPTKNQPHDLTPNSISN